MATALPPLPSKVWQKPLEYLSRNLRCFSLDPNLFIMRKLARFEWVRNAIVRLRQQPITSAVSTQANSAVQPVDVDAAVSALQVEGCFTGLRLRDDVMQGLLDFASTNLCYGDRNPNLAFHIQNRGEAEERFGRSLLLGSYLDTHQECPAFQAIKNDPTLKAIAAQYFGRDGVYLTSELAWSFPTTSSLFQQLKAAQVLHYDIDDYRCLKFFFYLTDVDEQSGPHVCLKETHRNKKFLHQLIGQRCASISDEDLIQMYGEDKLLVICGEAGTGFAEDIFCFHRGTPPEAKPRLLLQLEYTLNFYENPRMP